MPDPTYDIAFYWDPVCPFAWMTSKWIRTVQAQRDYSVDWKFISLRLLNKHVDYPTHFPEGYDEGHTAGLKLLRVAASVRADHGHDAMAALYPAISGRIFDVEPGESGAFAPAKLGPAFIAPILESLDLPVSYAEALDDTSFDAELDAETEEALALTGRDVGTPIIAFRPPDGPAFFGPVISRLPSDEDAVRLWDLIVDLTSFPGFSELKRSLREFPQLRAFGGDPDAVGVVEDWHGGSRKLKK